MLDHLTGDAQTFVEKVWASRVHHHRAEPGELAAYLSLEDADHLLTSTAIRTPSLRLVRDGSVLPESTYTRPRPSRGGRVTGLVDARKALALFEDGATVVFQGLHRYWPPLTRLIAELELDLGHPCQANAYLTPVGARGFDVHRDPHDVFVLQTAGAKQWEMHGLDGVEEPLFEPGPRHVHADRDPARRAHPGHHLLAHHHRHQPADLARSRDPRDQRAGREGAGRAPAGRLPRRPAGARPPARPAPPRRGRRAARRGPGRRVEDEVRRFLTQRPPRLPGGLIDVIALGSLIDSSRLRRRPGHPCVLLERGDQIEVLLGDRSLTVPAWVRPALDEVRARAELSPADLPLDEQSRLVLCRRLVREGLLEVLASLDGAASGAPRASLLRHEPLAGTASTVRAFLLLENRGPLGRERTARRPAPRRARRRAGRPDRRRPGAGPPHPQARTAQTV